MADMKTVEASLAKASTSLSMDGAVPNEEYQEYAPATELFDFQNPNLQGTYLAFYKSAPGRSRWFCRRCGTSIGFCMDDGMIPAEWGWPRVLDIWLGTIDRADLEKEWMKPERALWTHFSVPWIRHFVKNQGSDSVIEHPLNRIDKLMSDDVEDDLRFLRSLGEEA